MDNRDLKNITDFVNDHRGHFNPGLRKITTSSDATLTSHQQLYITSFLKEIDADYKQDPEGFVSQLEDKPEVIGGEYESQRFYVRVEPSDRSLKAYSPSMSEDYILEREDFMDNSPQPEVAAEQVRNLLEE